MIFEISISENNESHIKMTLMGRKRLWIFLIPLIVSLHQQIYYGTNKVYTFVPGVYNESIAAIIITPSIPREENTNDARTTIKNGSLTVLQRNETFVSCGRVRNLCLIAKTGDLDFAPLQDFLRIHQEYHPLWFQIHVFTGNTTNILPRAKRVYWNQHDNNATINSTIHKICDVFLDGFGKEEENEHDYSRSENQISSTNLKSAMDYANAWNRPLILRKSTSNDQATSLDLLPKTTFLWNQNKNLFEAVVAQALEEVETNFITRIEHCQVLLQRQYNESCQVLVNNDGNPFHFEILESIMMLYPLPASTDCDFSLLQYTFLVNSKERKKQRAGSWQNYANTKMKQSYFNSRRNAIIERGHQQREVKRAELELLEEEQNFDYEIRASCYCIHETLRWLRNDTQRHFCVFHEACPEWRNSTRDSDIQQQVFWLSPHYSQYFLPTILPQFPKEDRQRPNKNQINCCIIGNPERRDYSLVEYYIRQKQSSRIHIHQIGHGQVEIQESSVFTQHTGNIIVDFYEYQRLLYDTCDVIWGLMTFSKTPNYFSVGGKQKLSGTLSQAVAYQRPLVLHEDLYRLYEKELQNIAWVEVHNDSPQSFVEAVNRMVDRFD